MKLFEAPVIEVITFTSESIMSSGTGNDSTDPPVGGDMLPWG